MYNVVSTKPTYPLICKTVIIRYSKYLEHDVYYIYIF